MNTTESIQKARQDAMQKAVEGVPGAVVFQGRPDPLTASSDPLFGAPLARLDGPLKVRGEAKFAAEFPLADMTYAALVYSTIAHGRIARIDTARAGRAPGVVLVMTHLNAPRMAPPPELMTAPKGAAGDAAPVFQDDRVRWNGQPVAVVLAETQEQADHAATLVDIDYAAEPAVTSLAQAREAGLETGEFEGEPLKNAVGDAEAELAGSAHRIDVVYHTPRHNHNAIELHAATIAWHGDRLRIHDASQAVANMAWSMAQVFGIDEKQVHVTSPFVGGGFGGKMLWTHHVLGAAAARLAGRPVRIMLSRAGVYRVVGGRSPTEQRVAIGADADGRFAAVIQTGVTVMTDHNSLPEPFIQFSRNMYASRSLAFEVKAGKLNMAANTFMRAPGESVGSFALECGVDELAAQMGIDPIELRRRNEPVQNPTRGTPYSSRHLVEAYRMGAERFGWHQRRSQPGSRREGEWLVGMGVASALYPYYRMDGASARIVLTRDGHATVGVPTNEMGMGTQTAHTQLAALRLGLPMEHVTYLYGDSALPGAVMAGGSQQTAVATAAVGAAFQALCRELLALAGDASPLAGLAPEEVVGRDGGLCAIADSARRESYADILARAGRERIEVVAAAPEATESQTWSMQSYGAIFCEARVNVVTGEPRVTRLLGSFDCGRIVNARTARSQLAGGMIMGLGAALMEETLFDERNGRIANPSLAEYHVPAHLDVPRIEVLWTDIPDPQAPAGARGIGEIGITGTAAAVANAIYNACGKRVRELPITLDKLL